ncbi:MAG TPA: uroporphyrinogen decarboxylase family protein [Vicinamibacterales bacterium]|mgnify:FL=1|nr:uroporphyrinogen decarboxylase family protein [Vicinamibacterales bacterium]HPW21281.1 uroporphyrinogen decarboxylase family protein [Vicinamibacterales bacterium]
MATRTVMTSRERVLAAMRRQETDRPPFDLSFGIATAQLASIRARTGADDPWDYFGADTRMIWPGPTRLDTDFSRYLGRLPRGSTVDEWGLGHVPTASTDADHAHLEGFRHPLEEAESLADIAQYPLPDVDAAYRYESVRAAVEAVHRRGLAAMAMLECTIFERAWYLRGMERLLLDFSDGSAMATVLLDRITALRIGQARHYAASGADVICYGDDVGTQRGLLMSAAMWRTWLKPRLAATIAAARDVRPDVLVFYHSDGNVEALIPDLIDIGVDILNPVQPECLDAAALKRQYGSRLSFWGTIGTQSTLPFGSPDDVRREVRTRIETVGAGGGLFLAPTHVIEPEVPFENLVAFVEAVTGERG